MDAIDLQLQDVIGDLEAGLLRAVDSPGLSTVDRQRAARLRATLGDMRIAVVQVGPDVAAAVPREIDERLAALRCRTRELLDEWDAGAGFQRIDETVGDTIRVMSVVGKWPPST
jgi:hypothetical protein